jgi:hydrogenase maturation protease
MIDAAGRGDPPGTVSVVEPEQPDAPSAGVLDAHGMQPDVVLGLVGLLGAKSGRVLLVGCEPAVLDHRMGLSPPVAHAVDTAVAAVLDLLAAHRPAATEFVTGKDRVAPCASVFREK